MRAEKNLYPKPLPRLGPRPLPLHLAAAHLTWSSSSAGLMLLKNGWPPSKASRGGNGKAEKQEKPEAEVEALLREIGTRDTADFDEALTAEVRSRLFSLLDGIARYRAHPYRRNLGEASCCWQEGSARLLEFAAVREGKPSEPAPQQEGKTRKRKTGNGQARTGPMGKGRVSEGRKPALLIVPSLINRSYILDLSARRSLCRWLAQRGFQTYLMDWGAPDPQEQRFSLSDYVTGYLERSLDCVLAANGGRSPVLVGYCMGGLLTLALAQRREAQIAGLALLATPWDFHAGAGALPEAQLAMTAGSYLPLAARLGYLPVDALQSLFALLEPMAVVRKFLHFSRLDPQSAAAEDFVAVEDWINDGVPLAAPVARECIEDWYRQNLTAKGAWEIAGERIRPEELRLPCLGVVPAQDRIVPPESALALCEVLRTIEVVRPRSGHVGMIVGQQALEDTWQPLAEWLSALAR